MVPTSSHYTPFGSRPFGRGRPVPARRQARRAAGFRGFGDAGIWRPQDRPPQHLAAFTGPKHTLVAMQEKALGARGEQSFLVRQFTEEVVRYLEPKDYLGEIIAIRNVFVQRNPQTGVPLFRYMNDPRHVELIKDPQRMVEEVLHYGSSQADCDEITCLAGTMALQLGREVEWVALGFSPGSLSHVGVRVKEPKTDQWIWLDAVAGPREREAARRAKNIRFWSID